MAFNPLGILGGVGKTAWGAAEDTFSGETVDPYKPNKSNFDYKGQGEAYYQKIAAEAQGQKPVQANLDQYNQSRGLAGQSREALQMQAQKLGMLAQDEKTSVAAQQMRAGRDANLQQALALSRSGTGGGASSAQAMRAAQLQQSTSGQTLNQQTGIMRAQEIAAATQAQSQLMMQQRVMDLQAQGLDAQTALGQAQLELGSRGQQNQYSLGLYGLGQGATGLAQKGGIAYEQTASGNQMAAQIANQQADAARDASLLGLAGTVGAAGILASDVRAKQEVTPASPSSVDMMSLNAPAQSSYDPMKAQQDAQRSQQSKSMIAGLLGGLGGGGGQTQPANPYGFLNYGQVDSDKRAKIAEEENVALRDALKSAQAYMQPEAAPPRPALMRRAWVPFSNALEHAVPMAAPRDVSYQPWAGSQATITESSAPLSPAEQQRLDAMVAAQRAGAAPPGAVTSDERSKSQIAKLESIVKGYEAAFAGGAEMPSVRQPGSVGRMPDVEQAHPLVAQAADVPASTWRYKQGFAEQANLRAGLPPSAPQGFARRTGPMADDLAQNPLYAPAVSAGPNGYKQVDAGTTTMANTAALSDLARLAQEQEDRIRRIEASKVRYPKTGEGPGKWQ